MARNLIILAAIGLFAACSDDAQPGLNPDIDFGRDAGVDQTSTPDLPEDGGTDSLDALSRTPVQDGLAESGHPDVETPVEGARAGKILGDPGFTGLWGHCRTGDFRLYNAEIEVCVQAETTNRLEVFTGGSIVDVRRVGSQTEDTFDLLKPRFAFNVHYTESVAVVRDGSDGGPAVIRVEGHDSPVAYLVGVTGSLFSEKGLRITTEYRLWPGAHDIEIVSWFQNPQMFNQGGVIGDWFAPGDRALRFRGTRGFVSQDLRAFPWIGSLGTDTSFAWFTETDATIDELPFSDASPWLLTNAGALVIEPGQEVTFRRWLAVGDGSLESLRAIIAERLNTPLETGAGSITVVDSLARPVAERLVELFDTDLEPISAGYTDENGQIRFAAASGVYTARIAPSLGAAPLETSVDLTDDATITLPATGRLSVDVTSGGAPATALVTIRGDGDGEFFAVKGVGGIDLAAGDYQVTISKGLEYDIVTRPLTLAAGDDTTEDVELVRSVQTPGYIAADFHQHMEPSSDSIVGVRSRMLDNAAEGVEFVATTDHDVVTDLQPYIDEFGLNDELSTFPGVEISPSITHLGLYPMVHDTTLRGNGAVMLATSENGERATKTIPEVIAEARALPDAPLVQLNHPRGGASLFEYVSFDPTQDPADVEHRHWSTDFDTIEIVNRVAESCKIMADWSTFLNTGYRPTGLGNSDTHDLRGASAGVPRNYLQIDASPGEITDEDVRTALSEGRVVVASHAYLEIVGMHPGDTLDGSGAVELPFQIRAQTPNFSQVTRLHVIVNGQVVESFDASPNGTYDIDQEVRRVFAQDSWVIFMVVGPNAAGSDYRGPTFAFTNPVFVDVDGDSNNDGDPFEAPGLLPVNLDAINETGWCD